MAWTQEQVRNANIIASVGRKLGASRRDIVIALMAAIVESGLRNVNYGDRDSLGLFQQRAAWGSASARTDPASAARMFFTGGAAGQRGLFDIHDRNSMSAGQAAQTVQVSAYPDRYAQHQQEALALLGGARYTDISDLDPENDDTLGRVPGLGSMTQNMGQRPAVTPSVNLVDPLGESSAADSGLGAVGGDDLSGSESPKADEALGELTFDNSGPSSVQSAPTDGGGGGGGGFGGFGGGGGFDWSSLGNDPMGDVHIPTTEELLRGAAEGASRLDGTDLNFELDRLGVGSGGSPKGGWRGGVVAAAQRMLGTPYVWGGTGYGGVDCSGLMQLIFKQQGIDLPRISADQARSGIQIGLNQLQAGDLVAWDNSSRNNGADHIALYIGDGKIIEAARPGTNVQISNLYDTGDAWGVRLPFGGEGKTTEGPGPGRWGTQYNVAAAGAKVAHKFGITDVQGFNDRNIGGTSTKSDHAFGLALDFMGGKQDLANYVAENALSLNAKYVIFNRHIWSVDRADEGWRPYDGENPHTDHVHVSFYPEGVDHFSYRAPEPSRSADRTPKRRAHQNADAAAYSGGASYSHPATHQNADAASYSSGATYSKPHKKPKKKPKKTHDGGYDYGDGNTAI